MDQVGVLIIGANGQLGKALQAIYPQAAAVDRDVLDITDWNAVASYDWSKVNAIINAAGSIDVDGAETPEGREAVWKINALAPSHLAKVAVERDIPLVHVSSDYVFDGTKKLHTEDEPFTPLGVYGQAKAAGDIAVGVAPKHYILRTEWLIGEGQNFVRTMMNLAAKNISPTVVADQIGRLTFAPMLAEMIDHLLKTAAPYGAYNASNDGPSTSWADITRAIFKELGRNDLTVTNTTTKEYYASKPGIAPRPLQSTFDLSKVKATGIKLRNWRDDLAQYVKRHKET